MFGAVQWNVVYECQALGRISRVVAGGCVEESRFDVVALWFTVSNIRQHIVVGNGVLQSTTFSTVAVPELLRAPSHNHKTQSCKMVPIACGWPSRTLCFFGL